MEFWWHSKFSAFTLLHYIILSGYLMTIFFYFLSLSPGINKSDVTFLNYISFHYPYKAFLDLEENWNTKDLGQSWHKLFHH